MKILVIGSSKPKNIKKYHKEAAELGREIAKRAHILVAGPSLGIQGIAANNGNGVIMGSGLEL